MAQDVHLVQRMRFNDLPKMMRSTYDRARREGGPLQPHDLNGRVVRVPAPILSMGDQWDTVAVVVWVADGKALVARMDQVTVVDLADVAVIE